MFGTNQWVALSGHSPANQLDTWKTESLSYDTTNDVWLVAATIKDGDYDYMVALQTITLGTDAAVTAVDLFDITAAPLASLPGIHRAEWPYDGASLIGTTAKVATMHVTQYFYNPSVCYDPDRKCWVMAILVGESAYHEEF